MSSDQGVIIFAFEEGNERVLLIRKDHPTWQRDRWNGLGGWVRQHESSYGAAARLFAKECGLVRRPDDFTQPMSMGVDDVSLDVMWTLLSPEEAEAVASVTDEEVSWFSVTEVLFAALLGEDDDSQFVSYVGPLISLCYENMLRETGKHMGTVVRMVSNGS